MTKVSKNNEHGKTAGVRAPVHNIVKWLWARLGDPQIFFVVTFLNFLIAISTGNGINVFLLSVTFVGVLFGFLAKICSLLESNKSPLLDHAIMICTDENEVLRKNAEKRERWLRRAKLSAGYNTSVSFDRVWKEVLSKAGINEDT